VPQVVHTGYRPSEIHTEEELDMMEQDHIIFSACKQFRSGYMMQECFAAAIEEHRAPPGPPPSIKPCLPRSFLPCQSIAMHSDASNSSHAFHVASFPVKAVPSTRIPRFMSCLHCSFLPCQSSTVHSGSSNSSLAFHIASSPGQPCLPLRILFLDEGPCILS
jgi:hypothetical protein